MGIHVSVDDVQQVKSGGDDDAKVAVAAVIVFKLTQVVGRITTVELVGFAGGNLIVGKLETLVPAVVEIDHVAHRGDTAEDDRHLPITFIVDLAGAGTNRRQRSRLFDAIDRPFVADSRIADKIEIRTDSSDEQQRPDHLRLDRIGLFLRGVLALHRIVLAFETPVFTVLLESEIGRRSDRSVQNRNFPRLFVIKLPEPGCDRRNGADSRNRHGIAEQPAVTHRHGIPGLALQPATFAGRSRGIDFDGRRLPHDRIPRDRAAVGCGRSQRRADAPLHLVPDARLLGRNSGLGYDQHRRKNDCRNALPRKISENGYVTS